MAVILFFDRTKKKISVRKKVGRDNRLVTESKAAIAADKDVAAMLERERVQTEGKKYNFRNFLRNIRSKEWR